MIDTESKFGKECIRRGFAKLAPRYYARCYGEGLYQVIYTGFRKYHDFAAIEKNPALANKKSYYITIVVCSLYSKWSEEHFVPKRTAGEFSPRKLLYGYWGGPPFDGIEEEYRMMEEGGFDVLDNIKTQQDLLTLYNTKQNYNKDGERMYNMSLTPVYLLCGSYFDASVEVMRHFTHTMVSVINMHKRADITGWHKDFEAAIRWGLERTDDAILLWNAFMGKRNDWITTYLTENYERNMDWVNKYGIPIHESFRPCVMPPSFFE